MAEQDKRTYEEIIKSFIKELNSKGAKLDYSKLSDVEKLELMNILAKECSKTMKPFSSHIQGYDWFWFHDKWLEVFQKYDWNCIVAARGLGKSFFWNRMLPDYLSSSINNYKIIASSYNEEATFDFIKGCRQDYEENEFLATKMSSDNSLDWNKSTLDFNNKSSIKGISITSQIRRLHVNYFIADDILNDEQKLSPLQIKNKIFGTILPVLQRRRGKFTLVGTRFSDDDIYAYFKLKSEEQPEKYYYCEIRVELDEINEKVYLVMEDHTGIIGRYLDTGITNLYDYQGLLAMKMSEPQLFAREYECKVVSDDDVPFPISALEKCKDKELSYSAVGEKRFAYVGGLDSANSTKETADSSVLMFMHQDKDELDCLDFIYEDNKTESPERLQLIKKHMSLFGKPSTLAEQNSMGLTNIQMLIRDGYRIEPFHTDINKKVDLTDYASVRVKSGKVRLPYKSLKDQELTNKLIHQLNGVRPKLTRTGKMSYDGTTKHDDLYIAFILALKQLSTKFGRRTQIYGLTREELHKTIRRNR